MPQSANLEPAAHQRLVAGPEVDTQTPFNGSPQAGEQIASRGNALVIRHGDALECLFGVHGFDGQPGTQCNLLPHLQQSRCGRGVRGLRQSGNVPPRGLMLATCLGDFGAQHAQFEQLRGTVFPGSQV